jgi:hypothetical protein
MEVYLGKRKSEPSTKKTHILNMEKNMRKINETIKNDLESYGDAVESLDEKFRNIHIDGLDPARRITAIGEFSRSGPISGLECRANGAKGPPASVLVSPRIRYGRTVGINRVPGATSVMVTFDVFVPPVPRS